MFRIDQSLIDTDPVYAWMAAETLTPTIYLTGGAVRDMLRNKTPNDLDFVVLRDSLGDTLDGYLHRITIHFGGSFTKFTKGDKDIYRLYCQGRQYDFVLVKSIENYALSCDLTINSLQCSVSRGVIEDTSPLLGRIHPTHTGAFEQDAVRVLRALRLYHETGYELTLGAIEAILNVSQEAWEKAPREMVGAELAKIWSQRDLERTWHLMLHYRVVSHILPPHSGATDYLAAWSKLDDIIDTYHLSGTEIVMLRMACYCQDQEPETLAEAMRGFSWPTGSAKIVRALVGDYDKAVNLIKEMSLNYSADYIIINECSNPRLLLLLMLCLESEYTVRESAKHLLEGFGNGHMHPRTMRPLIDGVILKRFKLADAEIGEALRSVRKAQVRGMIHSQEEALAYLGF